MVQKQWRKMELGIVPTKEYLKGYVYRAISSEQEGS